MVYLKYCISIFTLLFFIFFVQNVYAGLGISPPSLHVENIEAGSSYEKVFTLSNRAPTDDVIFEVKIDDEIKDYIKVDKGSEFIWPAEHQKFPVLLAIEPSHHAMNGLYEGKVRFISKGITGENKKTSGFSTLLGAQINVSFNVSGKQQVDLVQGGRFKVLGSIAGGAIVASLLFVFFVEARRGNN